MSSFTPWIDRMKKFLGLSLEDEPTPAKTGQATPPQAEPGSDATESKDAA